MQRVAFPGDHGAFSQEVLQRFFRSGAEPLPRTECGEVRRAVLRGEADYGILPLENSIAGQVAMTRDLLAYEDLRVVGEVSVPVCLALLALPGTELQRLDRVGSDRAGLAQCSRFLRRHRHLWPREFRDVLAAVRELARGRDRGFGVIAPPSAAAPYGLEVVRGEVQDRPDSSTRYLVVTRGRDGWRPCPWESPLAPVRR